MSDIHFRDVDPAWDEHEDYRSQLIADVESLVEKDEVKVDGILVGGDVAFSGQPAEFERATSWLDDLAKRSRCNPGSIWTVPGNHDVNRETVNKSRILSRFREDARSCPADGVQDFLRREIYEESQADALFGHLKEYNHFSERFNCTTTSDSINWADNILKIDDVPVLLQGLNSVMVSHGDDCGGSYGDPNMLVGAVQVKMRETPNEVRILICHHPPSWILDWDHISTYVDRAHVTLFGHEHEFGFHQAADRWPLRLFAGAVGPDDGAAPTYNLLTFGIDGDEIKIHVQQRVWSDANKRFDETENEIPELRVALDLKTTTGSTNARDESAGDAPLMEPESATPLADENSLLPDKDHVRAREAVVKFLGSSVERKIGIADKLGVLQEDDDSSSKKYYVEILRRIRQQGKLDELWKELGI